MTAHRNRANPEQTREMEEVERRLARSAQVNRGTKLPQNRPLKPWHCRICSNGTCPQCRDMAKWNARFEERYGAEMRAYYSPKPVRFGVSDVSET